MNEAITITREGRILAWNDYHAEQVAEELAHPDECIPFEVCDAPALADYLQAITHPAA